MMSRELLKQALEALEIGLDAAALDTMNFHESMRGYKKDEHKRRDADVEIISSTIEAVKAELQNLDSEPFAWIAPSGLEPDANGYLTTWKKSRMKQIFHCIYSESAMIEAIILKIQQAICLIAILGLLCWFGVTASPRLIVDSIIRAGDWVVRHSA